MARIDRKALLYLNLICAVLAISVGAISLDAYLGDYKFSRHRSESILQSTNDLEELRGIAMRMNTVLDQQSSTLAEGFLFFAVTTATLGLIFCANVYALWPPRPPSNTLGSDAE